MPDDALLVPVGHDLGVFYPVPGSDEHHQQVRTGVEVVRLDDVEFAVWLLCHGISDEDRPTRTTVAAAARQLDLDQELIGPAIERLLAQGLAAEVEPGGSSAMVFAAEHRLIPLMLGLGQDADEPWLRTIGLLNQPIAQVSSALYDLWAWAHLAPQLWAACHDAAEVARLAGILDPAEVEPREVLTGLLWSIHGLLSTRAACFDRRAVRQAAV